MNLVNFSRGFGATVRFSTALATALFIVSCGSGNKAGNSNNAENKAANEPVVITAAKSEAKELPAYVQVTGTLIADETSDVSPLVAGKLISTPVNIGDFIRQGQVIAQLDDRDAKLRVKEAEVGIKQAEVGVRQAEAKLGLDSKGNFVATNIPEVRQANADYQVALADQKLAESNEKRYRELVETGDVAAILYDQYRTTRDTARAKSNAAKQALESAKNTATQSNEAVRNARVTVDAAKNQLEVAQKSVADMIVRSPYSGYVAARGIAIGEFVSTSTPLITLVRTNPLKANLSVGEAEVPTITAGMSVSLNVEAWKDRNFAGTVTAVNPSIDQTSRSALVEAQFDNSDNALRSGMFATAKILRQGGSQGVFVPKAAVLSVSNTQSYRVFVIQDGVAKLRVVQLGQEENDKWQIINGVAADETVATSSLDQLYEGSKVIIQ
jgi:multidrug efflux pump subunit AcrA (membrane-fusion protein)